MGSSGAPDRDRARACSKLDPEQDAGAPTSRFQTATVVPEIRRFRRYQATYKGQSCEFTAGWQIGRGPRRGEWAMIPDEPFLGSVWVPSCDLPDLRELHAAED